MLVKNAEKLILCLYGHFLTIERLEKENSLKKKSTQLIKCLKILTQFDYYQFVRN
jgi:hypothetical protein